MLGRKRVFRRVTELPVVLLALGVTVGCAPKSPPVTTPEPAAAAEERDPAPAPPDFDALVGEAIERSEEAYLEGLNAYRSGKKEQGRDYFDQSLRSLVQVDPVIQGDRRLIAAYRDLLEDLLELESLLEREAEEPGIRTVGTPKDQLGEVTLDLTPEEESREVETTERRPKKVRYDLPVTINEKVLRFVDLYQGDWRDQFEAGFRRSGRYEEMIRRTFAQEGVPKDLTYLAHVESSFKPKAYSRARAYGMFQFMAATGRNYGLSRNQWVDERADPEKAARAAARYLKRLHEMFGDWELAMAGYNAGEAKVQRAVRSTGSRDFWTLARTRYVRRETRNFVPAIMAAILIYKSPEEYGFDPALRDKPLETDWLTVDHQADLQVIAECAGSDPATLRKLNPELRTNATPPGRYRMRVPQGTAKVAQARLEEIPASERMRQVVHVVRRGETLSHIARRYGTSVTAIKQANGIGNPRYLRQGARLTIPLRSGVYVSRAAGPREVDAASGKDVYGVRRGDSPYIIALTHGVRLNDLLSWNGLSRRSVIHPGDRLYLENPGPGVPVPSRRGSGTYRVRSGDTLSRIARRQGVAFEDLLAWNGLHRRSVIYPGQRLVVSVGAAEPLDNLHSKVYVVKRGDTLYDISRAHSVGVADICRWNGISSRRTIHAGDRLTIYLD